MITLMDINKIHHHPQNPRRDLGDLTELAESIKQSGILQNLTLVPWYSMITGVGADSPEQQEEMGYYAVIGNRRLAAAKIAGLTEVPCVIADMDNRTQIATMLLENMQRSDLTIWEQAQGFQMMLNLGENVSNISSKTGFSESTVRRRMKLLELDQEKLKKSVERGATFMDYAELEKIESMETRNKVLEKIGTNEFAWTLKKAIEDEKKGKKLEEIIKGLDEFAERAEYHNNFRYINNYYGYDNEKIEKPEDADEVQYYYTVNPTWIGLYIDYVESENTIVASEEDIRKAEKRKALDEITRRSFELRYDFIKNTSFANAKKNIGAIIQSAIYAMGESYNNLSYGDLAGLLNVSGEDEDYEDGLNLEVIAAELKKNPELSLLFTTYLSIDDRNESCYDWRLEYRKNKDIVQAYNLLENIGYQISEEEKALCNGTHKLFGE